MSTLKLMNASVRVSNENDTLVEYKCTATVSVNDENKVTGINGGQVVKKENGNQVASFDTNRAENINYQFNGIGYEEQKEVIDVIAGFVSQIKSATIEIVL